MGLTGCVAGALALGPRVGADGAVFVLEALGRDLADVRDHARDLAVGRGGHT